VSTIALWLLSVGVATLGASASAELRARISPRARAKRAAFRLPRTRIEDVKTGDLVRVEGRIELVGEPLVAPLSQRRCAHYELSVEFAKTGTSFVKVLSESRSTPFSVVDESKRALVALDAPLRGDVDRNIAEVVVDHYWTANDIDAETRFELERYLFSKGDMGRALLAEPKRLRYAEGALEEGERVHVAGVAEWVTGSEVGHSYRDSGQRLVLRAPPRGRLFVTDHTED
jgi:hypothetical protein